MNPRQRNIPVTTKEQSEVQTDVKLIESYLLESRHEDRQHHPTVTLSQSYSRSGLLRPFTDNSLLRELGRNLQELKDSEENQGAFAKRLQILEEQIQGLLRRDLLINGVAEGSEAWSSYYHALNDKQKTIISLENEKIYSDLKIRRLQDRIEELEREAHQLRCSVVATQKMGEENKLYASFYEKLNTVINTSKRRGADFEALLNQQVVPMVADFSLNLNALSRTINRDIHVSLRPTINSLAREFDRLLKEQQFTEDKIGETVSNLLVNFKAVGGVEHMKLQFDLANRTSLAQGNYRNVVALFRHQIENLKQENPSLKTVERIDVLLRRLDAEGVEIIDCKGWMNLVLPEIKVVQVGSSDVHLKELIATLGGEFKRLYETFPELKSHVSTQAATILQSEVLKELLDGGSLERIKEIVVHQVNEVKVDNVYLYQSHRDTQVIFRLRVLVKVLLQELEKLKKQHGVEVTLDQGILGLLKDQVIEGVDLEAVIGLFRPPCKYVTVPVVVEKPVYKSNTYEKGVPIKTETPVLLEQTKTEVVVINKEVPVYIEKPVEGASTVTHVAVSVEAQKAVPVQVAKEVVVERVVESSMEVPVEREKSVPLYEREEVVKEIPVDRIVEVVQVKQVERIVQAREKQYVQVERIVQVPHYIYETRQQVKQIQVRVPHIIRQPEYVQVEKQVTYIVERNQVVNIVEQVPVEIRVPEVKLVELSEIRDKVIVTNEYNEVVKEIPVIREKELIKEVPKEIFIERSHFIKGDQVEVIREVEVLVEKPIIQEILVTKDVQVEKVVPLYITEQVPLLTEINVPVFSERVRELQVEKVKLIPVKQEVVKQVNVDRPVPVVVEKEVVRVEKQIVERIVQKIVEVPRVVEVEKIVEKIVVVPRIIEKIVEVPKIIEKIVIVEQPILQIVEIPVPQIIIQVVEKIVQVIVEKPVIQYEKVIEQVQVQRIVERVIEKERAVQVQVERRIPVEVIREVPVPTYRDRIEYQRVEIHETKVETIEVQVPIVVAEKVPFIQEKAIVTEHIIEKPVIERAVVEKEVPVITEVEKLVVKEIVVEKAVLNEIVKEIPIEKIVYRDVPQIVEVIRDKLVEILTVREVPKEIILEQDKVIHQIHEKIVEVPVNQIITTPQIIEVPKIVNLVHYKEIAVDVPVREERIKRDIVEQIKEVEVIREVPVEVEICREKIKEVVNQVKEFITKEVIKEIQTEVAVRGETETQVVELPAETIVQTLNSSEKDVEVQERIIERLVEKIVMLPQIVEVVKHVHHISEVNSLGVTVDVDINVQTEKYLGVSVELRKGLVDLLSTFKANVGRQPDLKALITIIEKYLKCIDDWIKFPKLVEIIKEVPKDVVRDRPVLVPTPDKEKEATLSFILEKMITELRRIRDSHKITLGLDDQLLRIFFGGKADEGLGSKLSTIQEELKKKYSNFGDWSQSNPFLVNAFLQDHFALQAIIQQANSERQAQSEELSALRMKLENAVNQYNNLLCFNRKMFEDNSSLIRTLEKYRNSIDEEEFTSSISTHKKFYQEIIEEKHSIIYETIRKSTIIEQRYSIDHQQSSSGEREGQIGELIGKLSRYENRNQELQFRNRKLQGEISKLDEENKIKTSVIKRLETDFEARVSRVKEDLSKNPNLSKEIVEQNKKLQDKIRTLEREIATEKAGTDRIKKELQRNTEIQKRDHDRQLERKEKEIKDAAEKAKREVEREVNRLKAEVQKLRREKEKLQAELAETKRKSSEQIKSIRELQMSSASDKYNQLLNENVELRRKNDGLQAEYDKLKKSALENNSANEREIARLRTENEKLASDKKEYERNRKKEGFLDLPQETQIINRSIQLERKLKQVEGELERLKTKDENSMIEIKTLKEKVKKLEIELEIARKEIEAAQKSRLQATTYQSGFKPAVSIVENVEGSVVRSPRSPGFKSGSYDKGYMSPQESSLSREERIEQFGSSSSRVSQSSEDQGLPPYYSAQMTLREFIDAKHGDEKERDMYVTLVMIKVIEKIEEQAEKGIYNSYTPSNIYLSNFNTKHLDKLTVKFGAQITNRNSKTEGIYLSPEVLGGASSTRKSIVFCLGVILDELIHGSTFFRSTEDIQNLQSEFKVRGEKLNPILKNTLFEMMNKQPTKRLDLLQAKRRLSLQKYITTESRSTLTVTSRTARRTTEQS